MKNNIRYQWPLHFILLLTNWLPDNVVFIRFRGFLARPFFNSCGKRLGIGRNVVFYNPSKISIGDDVYIAFGCWFSAADEIIIGDEVLFGPYNVVVSGNHTRLNGSFRFGKPSLGVIRINKGAWLGAHCTTTASSVVGSGSLIASNTVIKGSLDDNSLYAGQSVGRKVKSLK